MSDSHYFVGEENFIEDGVGVGFFWSDDCGEEEEEETDEVVGDDCGEESIDHYWVGFGYRLIIM
jgi:hypothetical protein